MWRKNRRRISPSRIGCVGVDLNRNFDALWDFRRHFAADFGVSASDNPATFRSMWGRQLHRSRRPRTSWRCSNGSEAAGSSMCIPPSPRYSMAGASTRTNDEPADEFPEFRLRWQARQGRRRLREFIEAADLTAVQDLGRRMNDAITAASLERRRGTNSAKPSRSTRRRGRVETTMPPRATSSTAAGARFSWLHGRMRHLVPADLGLRGKTSSASFARVSWLSRWRPCNRRARRQGWAA